MRLLLLSDLHLDTPFRWAPPSLARARRQALRDTLSRAVALAHTVGAGAICSAGDLYEHDRFAPDTGEFLRATFGDAEMPVLLAPGNHDFYSRASLYAQVDWPANVTVFSDDRLTPHELTDGLTVWGAAHRAPANTDGFLDDFTVDRGGLHLALFHGSEAHALAFQESGKVPHAPFRGEQVPAAGFAHALVGHFHTPVDAPHHTYPGNPEPLSFGESGQRGVVVVDVAADGTVRRERHTVAGTTVTDLTIDLAGARHNSAVRDVVTAALASCHGVVRATLTGEVAPEVSVRTEDLRSCAPHLAGLVLRTDGIRAGYDLAALATEKTVRGQFVREVAAANLPPDEQRRVIVTGLRALDGRTDELEVV